MPIAVQLNLKLANEAGTLARLCRDLAHLGINLLGLSAPETSAKKGPIRLLVANPELAQNKIREAGYSFSVEEVVYVELKNRPGAIARAMEKLARADIDVKYVYATAYTKAQKTAAVVSVAEEDLPRALRLLR
jgi:hypothetical protein